MLTYQDFEPYIDLPAAKAEFVQTVINEHIASEPYRLAITADMYDRKQNTGVDEYLAAMEDIDFKLNKIRPPDIRPDAVKTGIFRRLNIQRTSYSLGNGVTFADENIKEALGTGFDEQLYQLGYYACIHGEAFGYWNLDHLDVIPLTRFAPLYDERNGRLRAGVYFWRLQPDTPIRATLYEEAGYTNYGATADDETLLQDGEMHAYKVTTVGSDDYGEESVLGESYGSLPIVPLWSGRLRQPTLVELKPSIDQYDLIVNGFCNDLQDCAQVYWLVSNYGGMQDDDLRRFTQRLKCNHIANVDNAGGDGSVTPYTQEIPTQARETLLKRLHDSMYEDFGGLDVHCVDASSTNDHLEAAYQPLDENARDFEKQVTKFIKQVLKLAGLPDERPTFTHQRISNTKEQADMVLSEASIIGNDVAIDLLPNLTPEQKQQAKDALAAESAERETMDETNDVDASSTSDYEDGYKQALEKLKLEWGLT